MDKIVQKFSSFEEAEKADDEYYRRMTPQERLDLVLELSQRLRDPDDENSERLARVYRIVKLPIPPKDTPRNF